MLTAVMYHYVRDLPNTRYPRIAGLQTSRFEGQLNYIERHYSVVSAEAIMAAARGEAVLPANACHLSFDDGFRDHFDTVLPRLVDRGMSASFYPSAAAVREHRVLDVHKIHFLLATESDIAAIKGALLDALPAYRGDFSIPSDDELYTRYARAGRFDGPEVIFVKRLLQVALPQEVRGEVLDALFRRFVTEDEKGFAQELYMGLPDLREMVAAGMHVGGHGYEHRWLGKLSLPAQEEEIERTRAFLGEVCDGTREWSMCYPHGSYNSDTLELLRERGCAFALTTKVGLSDLDRPLELDRIDTNDLPCAGSAAACEWTLRAMNVAEREPLAATRS